MQIDTGFGEHEITLKGPKTAFQVLDAILRAIRGEPASKVYTANDMEMPSDCSKCPRYGFAGIKELGMGADGVMRYKALWSQPFCCSGILGNCQMITAETFVPEAAVNK